MLYFRKLKWSVHVLHSSITIEEQDIAVKLSAPPGHRKIFLSTNIAESSLTMKDVKYGNFFTLQDLSDDSSDCHKFPA